jgi:hypothetical protein
MVNIWLFCNFLFKTTRLTRNVTNALLNHIVTGKVTTCYQRMHAFSTELCALSTVPSRNGFWHFPCHFISCDYQDVSFEHRSDESRLVPRPYTAQQTAVLWRQFGLKCLEHPMCIVHPWHGTTWLTSFRSSGEAKSNNSHLINHNSPPPIPILIQMHSDHITIFKIHFLIMVQPTSGVARFVTPKNSNRNGNPWH